MMGESKTRLALLDRGEITEANVINAYYDEGAPAGWKVEYNFKSSFKGEQKGYWGWSQGPKKYYINLSNGDKISVIYDPCDPRKNCEIRRFLNNPSFRSDFKKANKLYLLDKYKDGFELEEYKFKQWYNEQQNR